MMNKVYEHLGDIFIIEDDSKIVYDGRSTEDISKNSEKFRIDTIILRSREIKNINTKKLMNIINQPDIFEKNSPTLIKIIKAIVDEHKSKLIEEESTRIRTLKRRTIELECQTEIRKLSDNLKEVELDITTFSDNYLIFNIIVDNINIYEDLSFSNNLEFNFVDLMSDELERFCEQITSCDKNVTKTLFIENVDSFKSLLKTALDKNNE